MVPSHLAAKDRDFGHLGGAVNMGFLSFWQIRAKDRHACQIKMSRRLSLTHFG